MRLYPSAQRLLPLLMFGMAGCGANYLAGPGPVALHPALGLVLPQQQEVLPMCGPDFIVFVVRSPDYDVTGDFLGIYDGLYPDMPDPSTVLIEDTILDQAVTWHERRVDGRIRRDALRGTMHFFLSASDEAARDRLTAIARTLTMDPEGPLIEHCECCDEIVLRTDLPESNYSSEGEPYRMTPQD